MTAAGLADGWSWSEPFWPWTTESSGDSSWAHSDLAVTGDGLSSCSTRVAGHPTGLPPYLGGECRRAW